MGYRLHLVKRSEREEIGRADVPVRITRGIIQIQVIRAAVLAIVAVTADKGDRREQDTARHRTLYSYIHFAKRSPAYRRE